MAKVLPFHSLLDGSRGVFHVHDDCPTAEIILRYDHQVDGATAELCPLCRYRDITGRFGPGVPARRS